MSQSLRRNTTNSSRMTKQRTLILQELRKVFCHPTADEVYTMVRAHMPHISLGTVYRNLDVLSENNEVLKLEYAGFQKRFDGNPTPHSHIRCERCGKVADIPGEPTIPRMTADVKVDGFTVTSARLEFFGLCDDCRNSE